VLTSGWNSNENPVASRFRRRALAKMVPTVFAFCEGWLGSSWCWGEYLWKRVKSRIAEWLGFCVDGLGQCHTVYGMKMTMHIDEDLLERVVKRFGCESKTEAVEMALKEMDRKARFRDLVKTGLGLTPDELRNAVDPGYDVLSTRVAESTPVDRHRKSSRRKR
jgi:Arc/MetJ family transcription regulator